MNISALRFTYDRLKDVSGINASSLPAGTDPDYQFDYLEISNVNYYGIVDPTAIERLRFEDSPSRARRCVLLNDTLISSVRPNLQAVAFVPDARPEFVCSTGFNVVRPNAVKVNPKFTYYALVSEYGRQYFEAVAKGVGYPAVDDKDFGSFALPLPELTEQGLITNYLDASCAAIDEAVQVKYRQLETLDAIRESIIEAAVTKGIRESRKRRIDQEWIDEIPAHWTVVRLKRILSRVDYGISESTEQEGRFAVLKMGNIQRGELEFEGLDYVAEVGDNLLLQAGDLLYNRTNSPDQVGKAAIYRGTGSDEITFASYLVRLRTNHRADPHFLNFLLNSNGFLSFARRLAIPSVQQSNINSTRYCRMLVPLPPLNEQEEIRHFLDRRLDEVGRVSAGISAQIETLVGYRKSLIHECVTGQRRVSEADVSRMRSHG
jgi:type I restriction enzyme S subunit